MTFKTHTCETHNIRGMESSSGKPQHQAAASEAEKMGGPRPRLYHTSTAVQKGVHTKQHDPPYTHRSMFLILKSMPIVVMNVCEKESFA